MALVSQSQFAKTVGRTRAAIWQRIKRGTLIANEIGKLDTENAINAQFLADIKLEKEYEQKANDIAPENEKSDIPEKPIVHSKNDELATNLVKAKSGQEVLKYKKLELEVKELQGELIRRDSVAEVCFDYLSALNINIMEMPQGFLDELEGAMINDSSRSEKIEIITKPICDAIANTISRVEKILKAKIED